MLSHFISILIVSNSVHAETIVPRLSNEIKAYYEANKKSCKRYEENKELADSFMQAMENGIAQNKDLNSYVALERKNIMTNIFQCDESFVKGFGKKLADDNRDYHLQQRSLIKTKLADFEKRDLVGSTVLNEFVNYSQTHDVELPTDPEMEAILKQKKAQLEKRKESCTPVMNLKKPLSVEEPRDQQGIGWCYAYTGADLLSNVLGEKVSAVYTAGIYNSLWINKWHGIKEGGNAAIAAEAVADSGICLEKDLRSDDYQFISMQHDIATLVKEVDELGAIYSKKIEVPSMLDKKPSVKKAQFTTMQVYVDLCTQQTSTLIQLSQVFPNLTLDQLGKVLLTSGSESFRELVKTCPIKKDLKLDGMKFVGAFDPKDSKKMISVLDEQLSKGSIAGVGYFSSVLGDYKNIDKETPHSSSIIGRRFNEKTLSCEYLLRNSRGKDCSSYAKGTECNKGHAWIAEEVFTYNNALYGVDYIEKK